MLKSIVLPHRSILMPTVMAVLAIVVLLVMPSQYNELIFPNTERVPVRILSVNDSALKSIGLLRQGEQHAEVEVLKGTFKGQVAAGQNLMMGNLENDKLFVPGDRALGVISFDEAGGIIYVNLVDHYRLDLTWLLVGSFVVLLVSFAGWTGFRSLISFVLTVLTIWKLLIPSFLMGLPPIFVTLLFTALLTVVIIALVYGLDKRALSAIVGSLAGTVLTAVLAVVFVGQFKIHGAVMPYSESLLYAGYAYLNLTEIFIAGIFLACSGAMMDVAVDITSAMDEILLSAPHLTRREILKSGLNVGRAVMGTMTTTLLLAYSGGFTGLLMVFMAQGTPLVNIINLKFVSSEILHTLIGSFGLVTVAPFTAFAASWILVGQRGNP